MPYDLLYIAYLLLFSEKGVWFLIHSAAPQSRPVAIIVFAHFSVSTSTFQTTILFKILQSKRCLNIMIATGSGRGDHWWHMSCSSYFWCSLFGRKMMYAQWMYTSFLWLPLNRNCIICLRILVKKLVKLVRLVTWKEEYLETRAESLWPSDFWRFYIFAWFFLD